MHRLIDLSLRNKFLVLILTAVMVGFGINSMLRLPIDAVPDVTPNQVLVLTQAPGLSPVEVERFITFPVETAMSGLPGITDIRSISRFGLSSVYIYFEEGMDIYFVRRLVMERLPEAREAIPEGFGHAGHGADLHRPRRDLPVRGARQGQVADGSAHYPRVGHRVPPSVSAGRRRGQLLRRRAEDLPGHARSPDSWSRYGLSVGDVFEALERNNRNVGGGYIEHGSEQYLVRGEGLVDGPRRHRRTSSWSHDEDGTPVYVRNVGQPSSSRR